MMATDEGEVVPEQNSVLDVYSTQVQRYAENWAP
jgi:hypothetical protein